MIVSQVQDGGIVHPGGTGLKRLTPLDRFAGSPSWSADGTRIIFHSASDIRGVHRVPTTPRENGTYLSP